MSQKLRILYIEDDEPLGDLFAHIVTELGYDVDVAATGAAGLSLYDADPHDIVFVDYSLPDTDGITIARKLLLDDPEKLIVLVTGKGSERLASEALSMGASDYIVKDSQTVFVELIPSIITKLVRTLDNRRYKKESEQRYQALLDEMFDAAIIHTGLVVVYANKVACELYGASSPDQLIGRSPSDLVSDAAANIQSDRIAAVTSDKYLPPIEIMASRLDGRLFPVEVRAKAIVWEGVDSVLALVRDITKQKETASKLVESEEKYRSLINGSLQGIVIIRDGKILFANEAVAKMHGYGNVNEFISVDSSLEMVAEADREMIALRAEQRLSGVNISSDFEYKGLHKSGREISVEARTQLIIWEGYLATQSTLIDVSDRVREQQKYQTIVDGSIQGIIIHRLGKILFANDAIATMHGYENSEELIGMGAVNQLIPEQDRATVRQRSSDRLNGKEVTEEYERQGRCKNGEIIWVESRSRNIEWEGLPATLSILVDVTARVKAEAEVRQKGAQLRGALDSIDGAVLMYNAGLELQVVSKRYLELGDFPDSLFVIGQSIMPVLRYRAERGDFGAGDAAKLAEERGLFLGAIQNGYREDQNMLNRIVEARWSRDDKGNIVSVSYDVTEQRMTERRYRDLIEMSIEAIFVHRDGNIIFANRRANELYRADELGGLIGLSAISLVHPDFQNLIKSRAAEIVETGGPIETIEVEHMSLDGQSLTVEVTGRIIDFEGQSAILSYARDVTHRKQIEEQLRQSQRMESIGQLTGGVAHDFNNLLQVFGSAATMIENFKGNTDQQNKWIDSIYKAVNRGKSLTGQLLSFSRQQTLTPETASPRDAIFEVEELLRRTLGENIQFMVSCSDDIPSVHIDVHGLQNAIVNLCINAAAAMQDGGSLAIDIKPVTLEVPVFDNQEILPAGDYVEIAVSDTGTGMDAETVSKAFDPFFTTKAVDEGTGLGLSMVYGFTKQSGGQASIESKLGKGTTVRFLLPVSVPKVEEKIEHPEVFSETKASASILVVEDDLDVRETTRAVLEAIGHKVSEAVDATSALEMLQRDKSFDVVFSDIVMPGGMSGIELAEEVASLPNAPKILLTSGYPDRLKDLKGKRLDTTIDILAKPFSMGEIKLALNTILQKE